MLCDGIRLLLEAFQTTKSATQNVREEWQPYMGTHAI
jgi:hypothetical protein